jgi:hypothetical protein
MVTVHDPRPLYNAIVARLESQTSKDIGDAVRPAGADAPYAVVYPLPDRAAFGTLVDPTNFTLQLFQVTCVGDTADEAQWMQHQVRLALQSWIPVVTDWEPNRIELDQGSGVFRDDDGPTFYTTDRFNLYVDP